MRRWVRYEVPMVVYVEFDENSHTGKVLNAVLATDHEDIALARDYRGQFLVYDKIMNRIEDNDSRAVTIADHRDWPQPDDWEQGPDALRYPGLFDINEDDPDDNEDLEPLDEDEENDRAR